MTPYSGGTLTAPADQRAPRTGPRLPDTQLPVNTITHYAWQDAAACRSADRELFFSPDGELSRTKARRELDALKICRDVCPVRRQCVEHALAMPEKAGVWGISEVELQDELQRRVRGRGRPVEVLLATGLAAAA